METVTQVLHFTFVPSYLQPDDTVPQPTQAARFVTQHMLGARLVTSLF
jgi:hypothetical protein